MGQNETTEKPKDLVLHCIYPQPNLFASYNRSTRPASRSSCYTFPRKEASSKGLKQDVQKCSCERKRLKGAFSVPPSHVCGCRLCRLCGKKKKNKSCSGGPPNHSEACTGQRLSFQLHKMSLGEVYLSQLPRQTLSPFCPIESTVPSCPSVPPEGSKVGIWRQVCGGGGGLLRKCCFGEFAC